MEIDQKEQTLQAKKARNDPTEIDKAWPEKEIEEEVSREVGEMNKEAITQGNPPTRFMPYPSLQFIVRQRSSLQQVLS